MPFVNPMAKGNPFYGTGSLQKLASGISGVTKDEGAKGYYVLFFISEKKGKGNAGRYLDQLKKDHELVKLPVVANPILEQMLIRRGFKKKREHVPALLTHCEVYVWRKGRLNLF